MDEFWQDLRFAARSVRKNAGFTSAAVLILALAVGLNGTLLTFIDALLFSAPAGIGNPESVVRVQNSWLRRPDQYATLARGLRSMSVAAQSAQTTLSLGSGADSELIQVRFVTRNYFSILQVQPALGRTFVADEHTNLANAAVIAHGFWRRQFGGDRSALGRSLRISDRLYTVIGVAPADFTGVDREPVDVWLASDSAPVTADGFWLSGFWLVGRLLEGVAIGQSEAELRARYPTDAPVLAQRSGLTAIVSLTPLYESLATRLSKLDRVAVYLVGAGAMLLLIACANVSGLLLNRAFQRRHEIAIRTQLGASRARILRQLFTEALLLNMMAGLIALLVISWTASLLQRVLIAPIPGLFPYAAQVFPHSLFGLEFQHDANRLNLRVLLATGFCVLLATAVSSVAPALYVCKANLSLPITPSER